MPWAFLPDEINQILNTHTAPKYAHDRNVGVTTQVSKDSEKPARHHAEAVRVKTEKEST